MTPADDRSSRIGDALAEVGRRRAQHAAGGEVVELDGIVMAFTNLPDEAQNAGVVVGEPSDPAATVAAADTEAGRRGQPLGLEMERGRFPAVEAALAEAGLTRLFSRPGMAADPEILLAPTVSDLRIAPVEDEAALGAVVAIEVEAFGTEPRVAAGLLSAVVADPQTRAFVGTVGGEPVAQAIATHHAGTVGVLGIGVRSVARRRGIGAAMTVAAATAFPGADLAWLLPTDMAEHLYRSLGFREVSTWDVWTRPTPS